MSAVAVGPPRLARDREKAKKRLLRSPRSMGGLARGRVRPDCKEGSRKRNRVAATTEGPVSTVLNIYNTMREEILSLDSPFFPPKLTF